MSIETSVAQLLSAAATQLMSAAATLLSQLTHFAGEYVRYIRNLMIARSCGETTPLLQAPSNRKPSR